MATVQTTAVPWHLWVVGIVSLLWNAYGGYDYVMTETQNQAYFTTMGMSSADMAFFAGLPAWSIALWAIGVWGSVFGSILLLARSRWAVTAFVASLLGALASMAYQWSLPKPASLEGGLPALMSVVILVVIVAQWYYARRQRTTGVLR